ncbi:MAG: alpha/beta fold hydrolase [Gemmatimonadota bacterium]|jgi:triacylglycerol lipase
MTRAGLILGVAVCLFAVGGSAQELPTEVPILLIPGWFDTERDLAALRIRLISAGWPTEYVEPLTFADPTGSNVDHAAEIGAAVELLRSRTGAPKVDLVAHSMGGLAVRQYLMDVGPRRVRKVVFVATPHRGTYTAYVAFGEGRDEMIPGSPFLETLNAAPAVPEGIPAITIRSPMDTIILPSESATLPGIEDHQLCCPTHAGLLRSLEVFRVIRRFLAEGSGGGPELRGKLSAKAPVGGLGTGLPGRVTLAPHIIS